MNNCYLVFYKIKEICENKLNKLYGKKLTLILPETAKVFAVEDFPKKFILCRSKFVYLLRVSNIYLVNMLALHLHCNCKILRIYFLLFSNFTNNSPKYNNKIKKLQNIKQGKTSYSHICSILTYNSCMLSTFINIKN